MSAEIGQKKEEQVKPADKPNNSVVGVLPTAETVEFSLTPGDFSFSTDPGLTFNSTTAVVPNPKPSSPNSVDPVVKEPAKTEPEMPSSSEFRDSAFEVSPLAAKFASGDLEGVSFSFSEALDPKLFENPEVWGGAGNFLGNLTWDTAKDYTFGGVRTDLDDILSRAMQEGGYDITPEMQVTIDDITNSFGYLFNSEPAKPAAKDRPMPTSLKELAQTLHETVLNREDYFHSTSGENKGRAYTARIENALKLLQDKNLDLNDPEVKKMVVAISRQLYGEGAVEGIHLIQFHGLLNIKEHGRNDITPEQFDKLVAGLSPDQLKKLLDGSVFTLKERLISPPKLWVMNKSGAITEQETDVARGLNKGTTLREVVDVVDKVWTKQEMLATENKFFQQTGYHTEFYELSNHYTDYEAGISAIEARGDSSTGNNSYINTLSSSTYPSSSTTWGISSFLGLDENLFTGTTEQILVASGELEREKEEEEKREEEKNKRAYGSWFTNPIVSTLALAGQPDKVIDTKFKKDISVDELIGDNPIKPVILSTHVRLPSTDVTDEEKA